MIEDMDALYHAKFFATKHHVDKGQQTYGPVPYTHHLAEVERVLRNFGVTDIDDLVAAWCHDLVEDTEVKIRDIEENFGEVVAFLVSAVTSEEGENRKIRNALTYPKIRRAGPRAIRLKLADRIANVTSGGKSLSMYLNEYPDFRHALYDPNDEMCAPFWAYLDEIMNNAKG